MMMEIMNINGKNIMGKAVCKGVLAGAFMGAVISYISCTDTRCNCMAMRRKTACVIKNAGKLLSKAADKMY